MTTSETASEVVSRVPSEKFVLNELIERSQNVSRQRVVEKSGAFGDKKQSS